MTTVKDIKKTFDLLPPGSVLDTMQDFWVDNLRKVLADPRNDAEALRRLELFADEDVFPDASRPEEKALAIQMRKKVQNAIDNLDV